MKVHVVLTFEFVGNQNYKNEVQLKLKLHQLTSRRLKGQLQPVVFNKFSFLPQTRCFSFVSTNWDQFKDKHRIAYSDK